MKTAALLPALLCAALLAGGCRVRDVRTVDLRVSGITDAAALAKAEAALRRLPDSRLSDAAGAREGSFRVLAMDYGRGVISLRYDSMKVGVRNLTDALTAAGFEADKLPPAAE